MTAGLSELKDKEYIVTSVMAPLVAVWKDLAVFIINLQGSLNFMKRVCEYSRVILLHPIFARDPTIEAVSAHFSMMDGAPQGITDEIGKLLQLLEFALAVSKRLPLYSRQVIKPPEDIMAASSGFSTVWLELLPGILTLIQYIDDVYNPAMRSILEAQQGSSFTNAFYTPTTAELNREIGLDTHFCHPDEAETPRVRIGGNVEFAKVASFFVYFMRKELYQLLAVSCKQGVLYFCSDHALLTSYVSASFQVLENLHITEWTNRFLMNYLSFIPRCLLVSVDTAGPYLDSILLPLLCKFVENMIRRLTIILTTPSEILAQSQQLSDEASRTQYQSIIIKYKYCGMEELFRADFADVLSSVSTTVGSNTTIQAKEFIETNMIRSLVDVLFVLFNRQFIKKQMISNQTLAEAIGPPQEVSNPFSCHI
jgi:hypothetical protein